jgi:hypothetical protein
VFTPDIDTPQEFDQWLQSNFKNSPTTFYPAVNSYYPSGGYPSQFDRLDWLISGVSSPPRAANELEAAVACNARYLDTAYGANFTYNYYFNASFGYHGFDLCWTFPTYELWYKDKLGNEWDICPEIRFFSSNVEYWRKYLVSFAKTANPNYSGQPALWTPFGSNGSAMYMDIFSSMRMIIDPGMPVDRCFFWQRAPYCKTCGFA